MITNKVHEDTAARDYWDDPEELAYSSAVVGKRHQRDPAHRWYRLPSLDSFTAGCSCGWASPKRRTFGEMSHEVDRHLDAARQPGTKQGTG